jgi:hypothetical protein
MGIELIPALAALNTLGALVGTGMTTYAEIFYTHAVSDGEIDHHERKYLRRLFRGFTFGMTLVLLSDLVLIVLEYLIPNAPQAVLTAPFWSLQILTVLILLLGWLLSKRRIMWWLGSAAVLSAWWILLGIDLGTFNSSGYLELLFNYVLVTALFAALLSFLRTYMRKAASLSARHTNNS